MSLNTGTGTLADTARCRGLPLGLALLLAAATASAWAQSPTPSDVHRALVSGRLEQAQKMIDRVLADHPDSAQAYFVAAEVAARRGNFGLAREELARAEQLKPGLPFASHGEVSELRGQLASAPARPAGADGDPAADEIFDAISSGRLEEAQQLIDKVLAAHPGSARAHYVAAEVAAERGRLEVARAELERAEELKPGLPFTTPSSVASLRAQLAAPPPATPGSASASASAPAADAASSQSAAASSQPVQAPQATEVPR